MKQGSSFPKIEDLAQALSDSLQQLADGKLSVEELHALTQQAQVVYERLVVLRYKAMEESATEKPKTSKAAAGLRFNFQKEEIPRNQTSLIDAIEEIGNEVKTAAVSDKPSKPKKEKKKREPAIPPQVEVPEKPAEPAATIKEEKPVEELTAEVKEIATNKAAEPTADYAAQQLADQSQTVADKLTLAPIASIKAEVGLNQKFRFINELFGGDAEAYASLIDGLDNAAEKNSALALVDALKREHDWEEENEAYMQLSQLVDRRHA